MSLNALQNFIASSSLPSPTSPLTLVFRMGYEYDLIRWIDSFPVRRSLDHGGFPRQGYQHKHGGVGDRFPKALRKKPRNRKGRFAE